MHAFEKRGSVIKLKLYEYHAVILPSDRRYGLAFNMLLKTRRVFEGLFLEDYLESFGVAVFFRRRGAFSSASALPNGRQG